MKLHPTIDSLQQFAGHEGGGRIADHLAGCTECRETVVWVRSARDMLRQGGEIAAPADAWERIRTRLADGDLVLLPADSVPEDRAQSIRPLVRAAAAGLILLAAGVAAAVPGSPVREWLRDVVARIDPPTAASVDSPFAPVEVGAPTIVAIEPYAGSAAVDVTDPDTAVQLRVRLVREAALTVRADGDAAGATFSSGPGRLTIAGPGNGDIRIDVPRDAANVTISVDGRPYLVRRGGELRIYLPGVDTAGAEIVLPIRR